MPRVLVPVNPGILSAQGMLLADVVKDYSRTVMLGADAGPADLEPLFADLEAQAASELAAEGVSPGRMAHERFLDMRYTGQSFEITVPFSRDMREAFEARHERQYGHRNEAKPVEVVNVRLRSRGSQAHLAPSRPEPGDAALPPSAVVGSQRAIFNGTPHDAAIIDRDALRPNNRFTGPAIVTEYSSTIVVPPTRHGHRGLLVQPDPGNRLTRPPPPCSFPLTPPRPLYKNRLPSARIAQLVEQLIRNQ